MYFVDFVTSLIDMGHLLKKAAEEFHININSNPKIPGALILKPKVQVFQFLEILS